MPDRTAVIIMVHHVQDRVFRVIVGRRRGLALSLIANVVLLTLLVFKAALPPPATRR